MSEFMEQNHSFAEVVNLADYKFGKQTMDQQEQSRINVGQVYAQISRPLLRAVTDDFDPLDGFTDDYSY